MIKSKAASYLELLFPFGVLAVLCLEIWMGKLPDINWQIALSGWSPIDWVAHLTYPENFSRDFPSGMNLYDKSLFMHIYPLAQRWLGVSPEQLIPFVILFEIVFLAVCAVYFCRAIVPDATPVIAYLFALLLVSGYANMDLGNFGRPFFWGLYYNIADGLRLLGIAMLLRRHIVSAALLFAVSLTVHPIMALMGCTFAFGYMLIERRIAEPRRLLLGAVLFGVIAAAWWMLMFRDASLSAGEVGAQTWISIVRTFSYHFFPVDIGLLTLDHDRRFLPLLSLLALATFYLPRVCTDDRRCHAILVGMLLLCVLTVLGLLISAFVPIPALIKLSLPRASDMLVLVALAIAVAGLVDEILNGSFLSRALACGVILSPYFMKPGFPVLPVILLVLLHVRAHWRSGRPWTIRMATLVFCCAILMLGPLYWAVGILKPYHWPAYAGSLKFWLSVVCAGVLLPLIMAGARHRVIGFANRIPIQIALMLATAFLFSRLYSNSLPGEQVRKQGKDYLEAQRWANTNTPSSALFMVDPTISYGWRDFSSRSSFGNLREWLHTSWLYDSRLAQYTEGKKRFDELGIDIHLYLNEHPSIDGYNKLDSDVKKRFYSMEPNWFVNLEQRYGVNYLVLYRSLIQLNYPFKKVFENDSFVIFKLAGST